LGNRFPYTKQRKKQSKKDQLSHSAGWLKFTLKTKNNKHPVLFPDISGRFKKVNISGEIEKRKS
jgi:hypothetical protein